MHWRQSVNVVAIRALWRVLCSPSLCVPQLRVATVSDVNYDALRATGVRAIVFDKDNTLTAPYAEKVHELCVKGLRQSIDVFGTDGVAVLSNSAGTRDDADFRMAEAFERCLGVPVIRHREKKPGGMEEVLGHFESRLGRRVEPTEIAMIGDRVLTDVVFGNLHGTRTVHVKPITSRGDNFVAAVARFFENRVILPVLDFLRVRTATPAPAPDGDMAEDGTLLPSERGARRSRGRRRSGRR